jgi:hypothetical protein
MKTPLAIAIIMNVLPYILVAQNINTEEAVFLKKSTDIFIDLDGSGLKIKEHNFIEKIFYRNFEKHSRESVFYSDMDPITNLQAKTLVPNPGKTDFKSIKVSTIETKDIVQSGIFYGGYKRKDFVFPGLKEGAIGQLEYTKEITDPHILSPFFFSDDAKVNAAELSVTFPSNVKIKYKVFGDYDIIFHEEKGHGKIKYSWKLNNITSYVGEKNSPSRLYNVPHVIVFVESYLHNGELFKVSSEVGDLYRWYNQLVRKITAANDNDLRMAVVEITHGASTDQEKVKAIFQWVQSNIKYIAFEDGMAGFIPRAAPDVYNKRYGDCKDMANLLKSMLGFAGVDAYLTWIGTRHKPYLYADVPCAVSDNHMICTVKTNGNYVFLDATNSYLKFGSPSSMIQGKEALIGVDEHHFEVVKVPVLEYSQNQRVDTIHVAIDDKNLKGNLLTLLTGYKKDDLEYHQLKAEIKMDQEYLKDFFNIGANNIIISNTTLNGLGDRNASANIKFNFSLPGYLKSTSDKIYINLNLNKTLPGDLIEISSRKMMVEQDYRYEDISITIFDIPENFTVGKLPEAIEKKWDEFGISSTYELKNNKIVLKKSFYSNYIYLSKDKFELWNELLQTLISVNQQSIILIKAN